MSNKPVHIVFQVINFLSSYESSEYSLITIDKLILIFLASHRGKRGIYPRQVTLAKSLKVTPKHIKARLKHLVNIGLISIKRASQNEYTLNFITDESNLQVTFDTPIPETKGNLQVTSKVTHRLPRKSPTGYLINNKEEEHIKTTERGRKRASPLTDDFLVNKETKLLCIELGFTQDEANNELDKFFNYYIGNGELKADWHRVMQNWMIRASEYKAQRSSQQKAPQQQDVVRSTVPWRNPDHATPVQTIVNGLTKGRFANGLGSKRKGTPTEN